MSRFAHWKHGLVLTCWMLSGCWSELRDWPYADPPKDAGSPVDAGMPLDSGPTTRDGGETSDGGLRADGGISPAGDGGSTQPADGGLSPDGGAGLDGGGPSPLNDAGQVRGDGGLSGSDAGFDDSGTIPDGGNGEDGGSSIDGGSVFIDGGTAVDGGIGGDLSCGVNEHIENGVCVPNLRDCTIPNGTGQQNWTAGTWGACELTGCLNDFHPENGICAPDTRACWVSNGNGIQAWDTGRWGPCDLTTCSSGYHQEDTRCVLNSRSCPIENGSGRETWDGDGWGPCTLVICFSGHHTENNVCEPNVRDCLVENGSGSQSWNAGNWGTCGLKSCDPGYHADGDACLSDTRSCALQNGSGEQRWNTADDGGSWGECVLVACDNGFHDENSSCISNTRACTLVNGSGFESWNGSSWDACVATACDADFHVEEGVCASNLRACGVANGLGQESWQNGSWGSCIVSSCDAEFHIEENDCAADVRSCTIENGSGEQRWENGTWGNCELRSCDEGFHNGGRNLCLRVGECAPQYELDESGLCQLGLQIVIFDASEFVIEAGSEVILQWEVKDADSCNLDGGAVAIPTGTMTVFPQESTDFVLRCETDGVQVEKQVPVRITDSDWKEVSNRSCAIKMDGTLWCWGTGIGNYLDEEKYIPRQESSRSTDWATLGGWCAIKTDGSLWCWDEDFIPIQETTESNDWESVRGDRHYCAKKYNGTLWCWGVNSVGQVGDGSTDYQSAPTQEITSSFWSNYSLGWYHTCGVRTNGTLWCWGAGSEGRLFNTSHQNMTSPTQETTLDSNWIDVSANLQSTCAIKSDGTMWCAGWNYFGYILTNDIITEYNMNQEYTNSTNWSNFTDSKGCAIKTDGKLWCWGQNDFGRLGNGTRNWQRLPLLMDNFISVYYNLGYGYGITENGHIQHWGVLGAAQSQEGCDFNINNPWPKKVSIPSLGWTDLKTNGVSTCAKNQRGEIYCWGYTSHTGTGQRGDSISPHQEATGSDRWSQLGNSFAVDIDGNLWTWGELNTNGDFHTPGLIQSSSPWVQVDGGNGRSLCGIKTDGSLWCISDRQHPTQEPSLANDWRQVANYGDSFCGIKNNGSLWCWGYDYPRSSDNTLFPSMEGESLNWTKLFTDHKCALKNDNTLWCFEVGGWTRVGSSTQSWLSVAGTCGIQRDNSIWCWNGINFGLPQQDGMVELVKEPTNSTWKSLHTSSQSYISRIFCGIRSDETLWCWHHPDAAGDELITSVMSEAPTQEPTKSRWRKVSVSYDDICAINVDDTIWCWGYNQHGEHGNFEEKCLLHPASRQ